MRRLGPLLRAAAADFDVTTVVVIAAVVTYPAGRAVAHWCHVADPWSWLYPGIADGLALVAYRVTERARGRLDRAYAWTVVVACAGMSAAGQAIHLAGLDRAAPTALRAAVGAWPALAGAVAWHLRRVARRPVAPVVATAPAAVPDPGALWPAGERVELTPGPAEVPSPPAAETKLQRAARIAAGHESAAGKPLTAKALAGLADVSERTAGDALRALRRDAA